MTEQKGNVHKDNKGKKGESLIRCVRFEPGKEPKEVYINKSLESLQTIIGGWLEQRPLFDVIDDKFYLLCNEEGKLMDACVPNCMLCEKGTGVPIDIIHGTFLIVCMKDGDYRSLTDEEVGAVKDAYGKTIKKMVKI